jgi:Flp pilus assembly protein TadG
MPKLKYRFRATFHGFGVANSTELTKQVVDNKSPSVKFATDTLDVYNSKVYFQGKPEWDETTINLRDDVTGAVNTQVGQQIQKQFDFLEQSSAPSGVDYKFQLVYDILDGGNGTTTPNILESWELDGCFLSSVDYGDMAYSSNDAVQIALTIRFDNAIQTTVTSPTKGYPTITG